MTLKLLRTLFIFPIFLIMVSCSETDDLSTEVTSSTPVLNYEYSQDELETMDLINDYRVSIGLNTLEKVNYISFISEEHGEYMILNNVLSHEHFHVRSESIIKVLGAKKVSENIAYNYKSAKEAFDAWLNSEGHRQNLEGDYTHFGISIRESPMNGRKYYTNIFAKI